MTVVGALALQPHPDGGETRTASVGLDCFECHFPAAARIRLNAKRGSSPGQMLANWLKSPGGPEHFQIDVLDIWPKPPEPVIPDHLPPEVLRAYQQAERIFPLKNMEESTIGMYGSALDLGLKIFEADVAGARRGMLDQRIRRLADQGFIPKAIADWANAIRVLRNEALHDLSGVQRDDTIAVRAVAEMVVRSLFTIPGIINALRTKTPAAEASPAP